MSRLILNRRRLLGLGAASAGSLILAGCSEFDFLGQRNHPVRDFLERANQLTYSAQRALVGEQAMAKEFSESEIRQGQRPNGSTDPRNIELYRDLEASGFAAYKLRITGLVETPKEYSLTELRNMPARTQITRHDCVEGWSCIAKWTGVPLAHVLDIVGAKADARFALFRCMDTIERGLSGDVRYYESIDLVDARHAQTILAYGMNDAEVPVENGAPLRLRVERQLGYKMAK
ncbi:MAG: molybdopterin-dependent oxidoreductase, partial [Devosia sp.]|nr:molybdopterin-dependent oxidoreductase [Devosia sp.]